MSLQEWAKNEVDEFVVIEKKANLIMDALATKVH